MYACTGARAACIHRRAGHACMCKHMHVHMGSTCTKPLTVAPQGGPQQQLPVLAALHVVHPSLSCVAVPSHPHCVPVGCLSSAWGIGAWGHGGRQGMGAWGRQGRVTWGRQGRVAGGRVAGAGGRGGGIALTTGFSGFNRALARPSRCFAVVMLSNNFWASLLSSPTNFL